MEKKKECEYCEDDQWNNWTGRNGHQLNVEIYPSVGYIGISS